MKRSLILVSLAAILFVNETFSDTKANKQCTPSEKVKRKKHVVSCESSEQEKKEVLQPEVASSDSELFESFPFPFIICVHNISQQVPVVVKLGATWCGYCTRIKQSYYDIVATYRPGVDAFFCELTVADRPALGPTTLLTAFTKMFNITITSIPSFIILYKGDVKVVQGSNKVDTIPQVLKKLKKQHPRLTSITTDSLDAELTLSKKQPVIIKLHAFWCSPCSMMEEPFEAVAHHYKKKATFLRLDTVENPQLAQKTMKDYNLNGLPSILVLKDGKVVHTLIGMRDEATLKKELKDFLINQI